MVGLGGDLYTRIPGFKSDSSGDHGTHLSREQVEELGGEGDQAMSVWNIGTTG